jgi:hypothetical protein
VYDLPVVVTERRAQVRGERTPRGGLVHQVLTPYAETKLLTFPRFVRKTSYFRKFSRGTRKNYDWKTGIKHTFDGRLG